jgi:release factor glutamine methyltransferase
MSIHALIAAGRQRLHDAGLTPKEAELGARLLAEHALGWTTERLLSSGNEAEPAQFNERYDKLLARRAAREPLAYIVGRQEFWGLDFEVSPSVLIPRPETELIVEAALERSSGGASLTIADVCTGCGAIAIAIARERLGVRMIAADISEAAVDVARRNAARFDLFGHVQVVRADLLDGLDGPFDMITANPPYVRDVDRPGLQKEVRDYEPPIALFAGADGLAIIRRLLADVPSRLRRGGCLIFEFGFGQDEAIETLVGHTRGLTLVELRRDLQGIARTAIVTTT